MTGTVIGFAIWCITGCFFITLGIYSFFSKKAVGFWANVKIIEVIDRKKYNAAMGTNSKGLYHLVRKSESIFLIHK